LTKGKLVKENIPEDHLKGVPGVGGTTFEPNKHRSDPMSPGARKDGKLKK